MRLRIRLIPALATTVALMLSVACAAADTPAPTPSPQRQAPTPTPVSPQARQTAIDFARGYETIDQDWEQFHRDFDQWRSGLVSCERSSAEAALRDFSIEFNEVLRQARNLPRSPATRGMSDQLVGAAESEAESLRQLRDGWQPADTSLFAQVESQRSAAAAAQQEVLDQLTDSGAAPAANSSSSGGAREFSEAFETVSADWKEFHDSFASLRGQQAELGPADMSTELTELVDQFGNIVSAVGNLPSSSATRAMAEELQAAAAAEDQALKELRDSFQSQTEAIATSESGEGSAEGETPPANPPETDDPFATLDDLVEKSDGAREKVREDLANLNTPAPGSGDVQSFRQQYDVLVREWAGFHQEYDDWRRTEGGCNRTQVIDQLGQFSVRFGEIAARVRNLPPASFVRPIEDTLVEATQREEEALRVLRNNWRPFATDVYRAMDQERTNAENLRRQAEVSIQELLERFGVSASEI